MTTRCAHASALICDECAWTKIPVGRPRGVFLRDLRSTAGYIGTATINRAGTMANLLETAPCPEKAKTIS